MTHVNPTWAQQGQRAYLDSATGVDSLTGAANENANYTLNLSGGNAILIIRTEVAETAGAEPVATYTPDLQFQINTGGYSSITTSSTGAQLTSSHSCTTTDGTVIGNILTTSSQTHLSGGEFDNNDTVSTVDMSSQHTEFAMAVLFVAADFSDGDTVQFRMYDNNAALDNYDNTITITIDKSQTITVGIVSEADSALALDTSQTVEVGIVSETNSTQTVTPLRTLSVGLASETDSAQFLGPEIYADGWRTSQPSVPAEYDPVGDPQTFTVTRSGFNTSGGATNPTDTITLMKRVREPYPTQSTLTDYDVALSEFIYSGETIAGYKNNSILSYPDPVVFILNPDREVATSSTYTVDVVVAHAYARDGQPVARVEVEIDDGTTTVTAAATSLTLRYFPRTGLCANVYRCAVNISTLTQGNLLTVDAVIYPWVGNTFRISSDAASNPNINLCPLRVLNDRTGAYGTAYAYVDGTGGGTPTVSETPSTAEANPYETVTAAAQAIQTYNNSNFSRNNASGGIIRLTETTHTHSDFSGVAIGDVPLVIEAADSTKRDTTIFQDSGSSVSDGIPDKLKFRNITIQKNASGSVIFLDSASGSGSSNMIVFENCNLDLNGQSQYNAYFYRTGRMWYVDCSCDTDMSQTTPFSTVNKTSNVIGCIGEGWLGGLTYNIVCSITKGSSDEWGSIGTGGNYPASTGGFIGWNFLQYDGTNRPVNQVTQVGTRGLGVVGNIVELYGTASNAAVWVNADSNIVTVENVVFMTNTVAGQRVNWLYNDTGSTPIAKRGFSRANVSQQWNSKSDVFGTDGNLTGNWPVIHKVGHSYDVWQEGAADNNDYGPGNWIGEVAGLGELKGTTADPVETDWKDDQSNQGGDAGGGYYAPGPLNELSTYSSALRAYTYDILGRTIPTDGTATAGAVVFLADKTVSLGIVSETDEALGFDTTQTVAVGLVSEVDSVNSLATVVGITSETDTAQTVTAIRTVAVGLASETDSVNPLATIVGQTTETDTVFSVTAVKTVTTSIASEADSALTLGSETIIAVGLTTETDSVDPLATIIGQTTETDTVFSVTPLRTVAVGLNSETDTVSPLATIVGIANETDSALAVTATGAVVVGLTSETDTVSSVTPLRTVTVGLNSETDTALTASAVRTIPIGLNNETDTASAVTPVKSVAMGIASEVDSSLTITAEKTAVVGLTLETDTAIVLGSTQLVEVGLASETNATLNLAKIVGIISEADTTFAVTPQRVVQLGLNTEIDSALLAQPLKTISVGLNSETNTALALGSAIQVGIVTETSIALSLTKIIKIGVASETNSPLTLSLVKLLGVASETDTTLAPKVPIIFSVPGDTSSALSAQALLGTPDPGSIPYDITIDLDDDLVIDLGDADLIVDL